MNEICTKFSTANMSIVEVFAFYVQFLFIWTFWNPWRFPGSTRVLSMRDIVELWASYETSQSTRRLHRKQTEHISRFSYFCFQAFPCSAFRPYYSPTYSTAALHPFKLKSSSSPSCTYNTLSVPSSGTYRRCVLSVSIHVIQFLSKDIW